MLQILTAQAQKEKRRIIEITQNKEAPFKNYKYTGDNSRAKFDSNLKSNNENIKSTDKLYLAKGNDNGLLSTNHKSINSNSSIKVKIHN